MKRYLLLLLLISSSCFAQRWEAELMAGLSGYNGDLTEHVFSTKTMGTSTAVNLKYNVNDIFIFRGGITWGSIHANDRKNQQPDLRCRNLNFHTEIVEANLCLEVNLFEPDFFI